MAQLDEWGADRWRAFSPVRVVGSVMFIDSRPSWHGSLPGCYVEIHDEHPFDGHPPCRLPLFCDIRQLGLTDSVRRAVLRRPPAAQRRNAGEATGRMLITARDLSVARDHGRAPACPYTVVAVQPQIFAPGLPCIVMPAPAGSPLAGHHVLAVDRSYRYRDPAADPLVEQVKAAAAGAIKGGKTPPRE